MLKNHLNIKGPQKSTKKQSEKPATAKSAPFKRVPPNQQQQEIWIHPESKHRSPVLERKPIPENGKSIEANLTGHKTKSEPAEWIQDPKVQKLALAQILNTLGILITNINMEEMTAHSQLSEQILKEFLSAPNPVTNAPNLVKLALIAISAVHHVKKGEFIAQGKFLGIHLVVFQAKENQFGWSFGAERSMKASIQPIQDVKRCWDRVALAQNEPSAA